MKTILSKVLWACGLVPRSRYLARLRDLGDEIIAHQRTRDERDQRIAEAYKANRVINMGMDGVRFGGVELRRAPA